MVLSERKFIPVIWNHQVIYVAEKYYVTECGYYGGQKPSLFQGYSIEEMNQAGYYNYFPERDKYYWRSQHIIKFTDVISDLKLYGICITCDKIIPYNEAKYGPNHNQHYECLPPEEKDGCCFKCKKIIPDKKALFGLNHNVHFDCLSVDDIYGICSQCSTVEKYYYAIFGKNNDKHYHCLSLEELYGVCWKCHTVVDGEKACFGKDKNMQNMV